MKDVMLALSTLLLISLFMGVADAAPAKISFVTSQKIGNSAFNDGSPGFDDLYMIKTQDKTREIIIYCNARHCYKNHFVSLLA